MNTTDFGSSVRFWVKKTNIIDFNSSIRQGVQNLIGLNGGVKVKRADPLTLGLKVKTKYTLLY